MSGRCSGCTNKYTFFEYPRLCPECKRQFCESCLPNLVPGSKKKNKSQPLFSANPCVYCIKQKDISEVEEAEILDNFQERYYNTKHSEPPIQSNIDHDLRKGCSKLKDGGLKLSEKDQALDERLKKLKGTSEPPSSADDIQDRIAKLRGEVPSHTLPTTGKVDETHNLIQKMSEEVKLDEKLDETRDKQTDALFQRLQALKGNPEPQVKKEGKRPNVDVTSVLEGIDIEIPDDDPQTLLDDLQKFQVKEEQVSTIHCAFTCPYIWC